MTIQVVAPNVHDACSIQQLFSQNDWSLEEEIDEYFHNALFGDTFGVTPGKDDIQEIEIFDRAELMDFFPSFESGAFKDLALENCKMSYYPIERVGMDPGLYFTTDVILGGLLDGPLGFFKMFLSESYIRLRLSAFLGFTLEPNAPVHMDKLVLTGCIAGLKLCYPPGFVLIEIITAGVRIVIDNETAPPITATSSTPQTQTTSSTPPSTSDPSSKNSTTMVSLTDPKTLSGVGAAALTNPSGPVTKEKDPMTATTHKQGNSSFSAEVFGNILFHIHVGRVKPLQLQYTATFVDESIRLRMVLSHGKSWRDAFGVEDFNLDDVVIEANIPTKSADKVFKDKADKAALDEGLECKIKASWAFGNNKRLFVAGAVYSAGQTQKVSYLEAVLSSPTWKDLAAIAEKLHGNTPPAPEGRFELDTLQLRITQTGLFTLYGKVTVEGGSFDAAIVISKSGLFISGSATEFRVPDSSVVIKEAKLDLTIARRSKDGKDPLSEDPSKTEAQVEVPKGTESTTTLPQASGPTVPATAGESSLDEAKRNHKLTAVPAKQAATKTEGTSQPATIEPAGKKEVSWYFGLKVNGVVIVDYGNHGSSDPTVEPKFKFTVSLSLAKSPGKSLEVVLAGKARSTVSLRDLCGDAIDEGGFLNARLSDLTILGTNADNPYVPAEITRFPLKKGFYVCATLDRVPLLEGKDGESKAVKKTVATDRAYLRIGYEAGVKIPKITVFLPPSFRIEFGDRFYTGGIYLDIDPANKPIAKFYGELYMRMEDETKKPIKFVLAIGADALTGSLELKMDAADGLKGPLGLSDKFVLYSLQGSVDVTWALFVASGAINSFGLGADLKVVEDRYKIQLRLGANPVDTLINIQGPRTMGLKQLANFIGAIVDEPLPVPDFKAVSLHGLDVYVSKGCTWIDEFYPAGIRFKGMIKLWDFEATLQAEFSLSSGFYLLTRIKGFELGPLKVKGARPEDPDVLMEVYLNAIKQSFFLTGGIEVFGIYCSVFIDIQYMPTPKFVFDFELIWSAGLIIKVHAEMVTAKKRPDGKSLVSGKEMEEHPSKHDWEVYVLMEQSILAQVKVAILAAIERTHKAMKEGIGKAIDAVNKEQEIYDRRCAAAEAELQAELEKTQREIDQLEVQLAAARRDLAETVSNNERLIRDANAKRASDLAQGEKTRADNIEKVNAKYRDADANTRYKQQDKDTRILTAQRDRDVKRGDFFSQFGNAERSLREASEKVYYAQREVDRLKDLMRELEQRIRDSFFRPDLHLQLGIVNNTWAVARLGLLLAEGTLIGVQAIMTTEPFRRLKDLMESAERYLSTIADQVSSALRLAITEAQLAFQKLQEAIQEGDFSFANLERKCDEFAAQTNENCKRYEKEKNDRCEVLQLEGERVKKAASQLGTSVLQQAVKIARDNNIALIAAKHALEAFQKFEQTAYTAIKEFVSAALDAVVDIQKIELKGVIRADESLQEAFELTVEGVLGGKKFVCSETWMPDKTGLFLAKIGLRAISAITGSNVDKEIAAIEEDMKVR